MSDDLITHTVSDDGCTLISKWHGHPTGVFTSTMSWKDRETAEAHREGAKQMFQQRIELIHLQVGQTSTVRRIPTRFGNFYLHVNTGPPTWWWPRLGISFRRGGYYLRVGWWHVAYVLAFRPGQP